MLKENLLKKNSKPKPHTFNDLLFLFLSFLIISVGIILPKSRGFAQISTDVIICSKSDSLAVGERYRAGGLKKFFLGTHYRKEWTTPAEIPVLDLAKSAGGMKAIKKTGGNQSKSLIFETARGDRFMFRSIDKDPSKVLPPELRGTIIADVLQDGISTAHPYGPLIVPPLAEAVGVFHTNPKLLVLPDDALLNPFREDFGGVIGFMEEFIINGPDETPGFAGLTKIVGTDELLNQLEESFDDLVDQKAYLKARLLDVFLSDWDRHFDQWRWARLRKGSKNYWNPIPIDRDQAFVQFDGLAASLAEKRYISPHLEGLNKKEPDMWSLTLAGSHSDRIFLNALTKKDFQKICAEFVEQVNDQVIEDAVRQIPKRIYDISGKWLEEKLKDRRKLMGKAALSFYENFTTHVEIVGRNLSEYVEINHIDDTRIDVKIFERDTKSGKKKGDAHYHRVCNKKDTKEIRLYLLGGDDKVVVTGEANSNILLRIIGGKGDDEFIDQSPGRTLFYDTKENTKINKSRKTVFKSGHIDSVINAHKYKPRYRNHGNLMIPLPFIYANSEDGFVLGAGMQTNNYRFRKKPYANRLFFLGRYAFRTSATQFVFSSKFVDAIFGLGFKFSIKYDPIEITNYYGLGNKSKRVSNLESKNFYRVNSHQILGRTMLYADLSPKSDISFGGTIKRIDTDLDVNESRYVIEDQPVGVDIKNLIELNGDFTFDSRDFPNHPTKGLFCDARILFFPEVFENENTFIKAASDLRIYFSLVNNMTFAFRARGEKIWGTYPFYEAAYLGGSNSLRAFRDERFGGDASALGSAELRFKAFQSTIIVPMEIGFFVFGEAGRVWLDGESPGDWHNGVGGGISFMPIYRFLTFSIGMANSTEGVRINASGGFAF